MYRTRVVSTAAKTAVVVCPRCCQSKDRAAVLWRMCVMVSPLPTMLTRELLLKKLLHGSSPRNPTYILGRILGNFRAQSPSELSVHKGEEVFILFEINEWAFVTLFANTQRRGYVPLDYCDVVQDFYDTKTASSTCTSTQHHQQQSVGLHADSQMTCKDLTSGIRKGSKSQTHSDKDCQQASRSLDRTSYRRGGCRGTHDNCHQSSSSTEGLSQFNPRQELYAEIPLSKVTRQQLDEHQHQEAVMCCCCRCNRMHTCCDRGDNYDHILKYLSQSELMSCPQGDAMDGSESGLGDSESVVSGDLMKLPAPHHQMLAELNDMSTQTSTSIENLYDVFKTLNVYERSTKTDLRNVNTSSQALYDDELDDMPERDLPPPPPGYENSPPSTIRRQLAPSQSLTPRVVFQLPSLCLSTDSAYSDSLLDSTTTSELADSELLSPGNDSLIIRNASTSTDCDEDFDPVEWSENGCYTQETSANDDHGEEERSEYGCSVRVQPPPPPRRSSSSLDARKKLALPILEANKQTNRIELTRLSKRIKETLKPTRDEIIRSCKQEKPALTQELITPEGLTADESDPDFPQIKESKKRQAAFNSIQEQYMKLEEARLLHNALKQLNNVMGTKKAPPTDSSATASTRSSPCDKYGGSII